MNVVHLSTYHQFGGAAIAATRLHRALRHTGLADSTLLVGTSARQERHQPEPGVVYLANNFLAEQTAFGRFVAERLAFLPYERDRSVRFLFSPAAFGANLTFHPAIQQADVLHLHWINFGFLSVETLRALVALNKPIVWTLHDQWAFTGGCHYTRGCTNYLTHCHQCPYLKNPGERDLSYRVFEQKLKLFADANICFTPPSRWLADDAMRSTLLRRFPFSVIPNPLDLNVYCPVARADANDRLDLPQSGPRRLLFGSASVTDPRKGFAYFAEALAQLHARRPDLDVEILIFGKGRSYLIDQLPYPVRHLGVLSETDDVVAAYNAADALVVPSMEDNLPNTILESLACGTPVVAFSTGGIPELIDHGQTGYLAITGSAAELTDGLTLILTQPDLETLRQNARHTAQTRFSESVVAASFVKLYADVCANDC